MGELLTLVASGDPARLDMWLSFDQRSLRLCAGVEEILTAERRRVLESVDALLSATLPEGWRYQLTGPIAVGTHWTTAFARSQTAIVSASSVFVFLLIWLYLRSFAWALLAMIPNAVALVLLFGAMGLWGVPIDMGSAIVAPVAIGIAADDSIHFLTAYARETQDRPRAARSSALRDRWSRRGHHRHRDRPRARLPLDARLTVPEHQQPRPAHRYRDRRRHPGRPARVAGSDRSGRRTAEPPRCPSHSKCIEELGMTTDRIRNLTPIEIAFAAFLLWKLRSSHLGCSGRPTRPLRAPSL